MYIYIVWLIKLISAMSFTVEGVNTVLIHHLCSATLSLVTVSQSHCGVIRHPTVELMTTATRKDVR